METATHAAEVRFQKSRYSTRAEVDFWVLVQVWDRELTLTFFDRTLSDLSDAWPPAGNWTLRAGDPVGPVGQQVAERLRTTAWAAIQAGLDTPCWPPGAAARWPRVFPPVAKPASSDFPMSPFRGQIRTADG